MNIKYYAQGSKELVKLYIRVYHSSFDVACFTGIFCQLSDWNNSEQQLMNNTEMNIVLFDLKTSILKQFNKSFTSGEVINKNWLESSVKAFFNRPKDEDNLKNKSHSIYFSDFANWWLENHSENWKVSAKKYISKVQIGQYRKFLDHFIEFEKSIDRKILLKDFTQDDIYELANWYEENEYNQSTIEREIGRFKFFANRAFENDIKVSKVRNQRMYLEKEDNEIEAIYLNEKEIEAIYSLEIDDYELDNVRDNFVLSCWFGLRINDFMLNLKTDNIKDGFVSIKTQKTGSFVKLPIHPMAKSILSKRFGQLPKKIDISEYNKQIKIICQLAEIDNQVYGKLWNPEKKRKEIVYAPKYKFVSSHIARKSLATNLSGKVSNEVIQSVCGWSNSAMVEFYNKTSKTEYAETLKNYWNGNTRN